MEPKNPMPAGLLPEHATVMVNGVKKRRKYFVLDTNVLLHDPASLQAFEVRLIGQPMSANKFSLFRIISSL